MQTHAETIRNSPLNEDIFAAGDALLPSVSREEEVARHVLTNLDAALSSGVNLHWNSEVVTSDLTHQDLFSGHARRTESSSSRFFADVAGVAVEVGQTHCSGPLGDNPKSWVKLEGEFGSLRIDDPLQSGELFKKVRTASPPVLAQRGDVEKELPEASVLLDHFKALLHSGHDFGWTKSVSKNHTVWPTDLESPFGPDSYDFSLGARPCSLFGESFRNESPMRGRRFHNYSIDWWDHDTERFRGVMDDMSVSVERSHIHAFSHRTHSGIDNIVYSVGFSDGKHAVTISDSEGAKAFYDEVATSLGSRREQLKGMQGGANT